MTKLISDKYLELNRELHNRNAKYGGKGDAWTERVVGYLDDSKAESWLDYGCGKGNLIESVQTSLSFAQLLQRTQLGPDGFTCAGYDPVTEPRHPDTYRPAGFDFVTCNDVLEHIEPECLDEVLADIAKLIKKRGLLVISQRLANKRLKDGRNAHLIVEPTKWWVKRLAKHFEEIIEVEPIKPKRRGVELAVLVRPWRSSGFEHGPTIELLDPNRPMPA